MNRSKIEWCDYSWNPITGCTRDCYYCYAKRIAIRFGESHGYPKGNPFRPTFHPKRLMEPTLVHNPVKIFTCSMGDMFDTKVKQIWRDLIFRVMLETPQHIYQVLTKQPQNINMVFEEDCPSNLWMGVTLDGKTTDTADSFYELYPNSSAEVKFLSCEPLLGPIDLPEEMFDWIIIGAQSGAGAKPPEKEWVQHLIDQAREWNKPVFLKDNLNWHEDIKEYPEYKHGEVLKC